MTRIRRVRYGLLFAVFLANIGSAAAQDIPKIGVYFSTEEDFVTQGPQPADGNPIISDGDLLHSSGFVYRRNAELLKAFAEQGPLPDLGLDAADVILEDRGVVLFSTELHDPYGRFTAGDLLATNGLVIPNAALLSEPLIQLGLSPFEVGDLGLDAVYFRGQREAIVAFLDEVRQIPRDAWIEKPDFSLPILLEQFDPGNEFSMDIWFSVEGTVTPAKRPGFLDGDLLSARTGAIVLSNADALPALPAGIPSRGVDFGMDAVDLSISEELREQILFSIELNAFPYGFTDGDVLRQGGAVVWKNEDLIRAFEPPAPDLGLDAVSTASHFEKTRLKNWTKF